MDLDENWYGLQLVFKMYRDDRPIFLWWGQPVIVAKTKSPTGYKNWLIMFDESVNGILF